MSFAFNPIGPPFDLVNRKSQDIIYKTAGENISALQYVYADTANTVMISTSTNGKSPIGIAISGAIAGSQVKIKTFGELSDPSFNYGSSDIFLNATGNNTASPVASGYHIRVAKGMGLGSIFIDIDESIELI